MTQELYSTLKAQADKLNANPLSETEFGSVNRLPLPCFTLHFIVENRRTFNVTKDRYHTKTANLYGLWQVAQNGLVYAVFSYGEHFPIAVYSAESNTWYETTSGHSVTTSCHVGKVRLGLRNVETVKLDREGMQSVLYWGEVR